MNVQLNPLGRNVLITTRRTLSEQHRRRSQRLFYHLYPEEDQPTPEWALENSLIEIDTIYAREKYPKHLEFFRAGALYPERCFMAANRIGKTMGSGGYEVAAHLTGEYPDWWEGRRFKQPVRAWVAGKTNETTRDILQHVLLGDTRMIGGRKLFNGFGVVPGHLVGGVTWKQGVPNLADTVRIKHKPSGGWSTLGFKAYAQGRGSFEGTSQHVILLDEEPPMDVYGECLMRTATTNGLIMLTFTPLEGMSEVVLQFLPKEMRPTALDDEERLW